MIPKAVWLLFVCEKQLFLHPAHILWIHPSLKILKQTWGVFSALSISACFPITIKTLALSFCSICDIFILLIYRNLALLTLLLMQIRLFNYVSLLYTSLHIHRSCLCWTTWRELHPFIFEEMGKKEQFDIYSIIFSLTRVFSMELFYPRLINYSPFCTLIFKLCS